MKLRKIPISTQEFFNLRMKRISIQFKLEFTFFADLNCIPHEGLSEEFKKREDIKAAVPQDNSQSLTVCDKIRKFKTMNAWHMKHDI